jgi:dolichol-phosphate mannosyltransferase
MSAPTWLVIPTYNEADGLDRLVRAAHAELQRATSGHRVLIVDDASPDGTGDIADSLSREISEVEVLHRPGKAGLGQAYRAGFGVALGAGAEVVVQMDADFSHDPSYLPGMLGALEGADLVLGSRYVPGGGVTDWGPARRVLSRGGCLYARFVLRVPVRDMTGGFKAIRREVLEAIELPTVGSQGYGFQIETTYRALTGGFRVREIPIVFSDRREGSSKMSADIAFEAMRLVPRLRVAQRRRSRTVSRR